MNKDRYDLPEGWEWVILKDIVSALESGGRPRGGVKDIKEGVPSIGGEHLTYEGGFNFKRIRYIPNSFFNNMHRGYIEQEDILIVKDGATTGKVSFVDNTFPFKKAAINEHVFKLKVIRDQMIPKYLFYFLFSAVGNRQILDCLQGSAQGGINQSFINSVYVPICSLEQQKRIVQRIESLCACLTKTKQNLTKIPPLLKKFRQSVLAKAFSGELTEDWRAKQKDLEPASKLLERIHQEHKKLLGKKYKEPESIDTSDLPELPEGWEWVRLGDVCTKAQYGWTTSADFEGKGLKLLRTTDISSGIINWDGVPYCKEQPEEPQKYLLNKGDILVSRAGSVGVSIEIEDCPDAIFGSYLIRFKPVSPILPKYVSLYLKSTYYWNSIADKTAGITIPNVNATKLENLSIPISSVKEQVKIIAKIQEFFAQADAIEKSIKIALSHCEKLTQSILAKAFRGELVGKK